MSMWLSFLGSGRGGGGCVDGFGTVGGGNLYENLELHESSKNECNGYRDTKSSFLYCEVNCFRDKKFFSFLKHHYLNSNNTDDCVSRLVLYHERTTYYTGYSVPYIPCAAAWIPIGNGYPQLRLSYPHHSMSMMYNNIRPFRYIFCVWYSCSNRNCHYRGTENAHILNHFLVF